MNKSVHKEFSRDRNIELCVLKTILTSNNLPIGIPSEYFCEKERLLFNLLSKQIQEHKTVELKLIPAAFDELIDEVMLMSTIKTDHAAEVLYKHYVERGISTTTQAQNDDPVEKAREIQDGISKLLLKRSSKRYNHREEVQRIVTSLEEINCKKATDKLAGYSTGIASLDLATGGIKTSHFYVLGALKKVGKSRFLVHLAAEMNKQKAGALFNSLEMSSYQLNTLVTSYASGIDSSAFDRKFSKTEMELFARGMNDVLTFDWSIYREYTVPDLKSRIIMERQDRPVNVVFVDFIQRMRPTIFTKDRTRGIEEIAIGLADLSRELDVAIIALAQLSGMAEDLPPHEIPQMKYFKESQGITENADSIWVLHNPKRGMFTQDYKPTQYLMRIDQRYGRSETVIGIEGDLRYCWYKDMMPSDVSALIEESKGTKNNQRASKKSSRSWDDL